MTYYWGNVVQADDLEKTSQAWAVSLRDVPLNAAKRGVADLAKTSRFAPRVAEIIEAAQRYMVRPMQKWDAKFAEDCAECLGIHTPLYRKLHPNRLPDRGRERLAQ